MATKLLIYIGALVTVGLYFPCSGLAQTSTGVLGKQFTLLPAPKTIELLQNSALSPFGINNVYVTGTSRTPPLQQLFIVTKKSSAPYGNLTLRVTDSVDLPSPEGYVLEIKNNGATVTAKSDAGIFYGCQTLGQLMQDAKDQNIKVPSCRITDYPDIAYRAIHLDLKHHLDSLSYYYRMMDRLAALKVNAIILEFEDKLKYESAPVVGASHAITIEDFKSLSEYAMARNIEISPLIQGLGHASFILKHPEYKELRDDSTSDWSFDPLNPKTYDLQFALYKDAIAATPHGKYLHIGGDEVGKLGMSPLAKQSGKTPFELQMYWLKKVCEYAEQQNRIPIFWDDMVFKLSNLYQTTYDPSVPEEEVNRRWAENEKILNDGISMFPKNCMYMRWNYDFPELPGNKKAIKWYTSHNLGVMAATSAQQIWPMIPRASSNFQAIKDFAKITAQDKLNGILLTLWDDASPHFETFWRGIFDFALFSWNYQDIPKEDAHAMFRKRFYGPLLGDKYYNFQDSLEGGASFWETALIDSGGRETYPRKMYPLTLPDAENSGTWSKANEAKLAGARAEIKRYNLVKQKIAKATALAKRNKYALQVFQQINELQFYPAQLLLKIEAYDRATSGQQKQLAANAVKTYVEQFTRIRKNHEDVITKSRILENPPGYLPDENHHDHLANGTINSDWMYVYELALNEKIKSQFPQ